MKKITYIMIFVILSMTVFSISSFALDKTEDNSAKYQIILAENDTAEATEDSLDEKKEEDVDGMFYFLLIVFAVLIIGVIIWGVLFGGGGGGGESVESWRNEV